MATSQRSNLFEPHDDDEKWGKQRINKAFFKTMKDHYPDKVFTNADAYDLYNRYHATHPNNLDWLLTKYREGVKVPANIAREFDELEWYEEAPLGRWAKMNVRNYLSAAAFRGLLTRVKPGHYEFTDLGRRIADTVESRQALMLENHNE